MLPLKAIMALMLALLYLPATGHCLLEQTGWFSVATEDCCESPVPAAASGPCDSTCCPVEFSPVLIPHSEPGVTVADLPLWNFVLLLDLPPRSEALPAPESSPPELPKRWQFHFRTAHSPRAPSVS